MQKQLIVPEKKLTQSVILMCTLAALFYCYEYCLRVAPSVMREILKETFVLGERDFGVLVAYYYYAYTPMQIPVGIIMDRFGPKRVLTLACFLCALGTYLFTVTSNIHWAESGRFLLGFGSAFAYVGVLKISNVWLPKKYFALMAGLCTALGMFGAISGEVIMSYFVGTVGWQWTLYGSALVGVFLTLILWLVLRDESEGSEASDPLGEVVNLRIAGLKEMIFSKPMWISGLIGCLTFLPISGFAEVWAVSFLNAAGMSASEAALGSSMIFLGFAVGGPIWGILSDLIRSRRLPLMVGSFVSAILMSLAIFAPSASIGWMYSLLFFGAFFASAEVLVFAVSNDFSRPSVSGTAVAFTNMVTMVGGMLLPPIIGQLLDNAQKMNNNELLLTVQDYSSALAVIPLSLLASGILCFFLKESYRFSDSKD